VILVVVSGLEEELILGRGSAIEHRVLASACAEGPLNQLLEGRFVSPLVRAPMIGTNAFVSLPWPAVSNATWSSRHAAKRQIPSRARCHRPSGGAGLAMHLDHFRGRFRSRGRVFKR
jgi:hypothetical protein